MQPPIKTRADLSALRLLLPYLRVYRGRVAVAGVAMMIAAGLMLGIGQGLRHLIDNGFVAGGERNLDIAALVLFLVVVSFGRGAPACGEVRFPFLGSV